MYFIVYNHIHLQMMKYHIAFALSELNHMCMKNRNMVCKNFASPYLNIPYPFEPV